MAKLGKLTKLKSAIKRWVSITKMVRNNSNTTSYKKVIDPSSKEGEQDLHVVYVGKSRRRYLVNSEVIHHRMFQKLVDRSYGENGMTVVSCEVVLFEHLLWMLESAEDETQLGSIDELIEFYSCGEC